MISIMTKSFLRPLPLILSTSLLAVAAFAADAPVWPMPTTLPSLPAGVNPAVFPMPRMEWVVRVKGNNDRAAQIAESIQLVFDGDSITDGWQGSGKEIWAERYGKLGAFDFGISGDRTEHVLWRLSQGQVDNIHPKLIAIMIGTNNIGLTPEQIAEGVKAIVGDYRKRCPEATILLQAIFPRGQDAANPLRAKIKDTNKIISGLADGDKVIYLDFGDKFLEADGTLSPTIMPDFLHPNAKGYQIWADAIQPVIDKYFPPKP
jgi:lysophospholipase L1-like esterase